MKDLEETMIEALLLTVFLIFIIYDFTMFDWDDEKIETDINYDYDID